MVLLLHIAMEHFVAYILITQGIMLSQTHVT